MAPSLDGCHQRLIESLGCCPLCDVDCREAVQGACEDDEHEPPVDDDEDSTSSGGDEGDTESDVLPPT